MYLYKSQDIYSTIQNDNNIIHTISACSRGKSVIHFYTLEYD
jgi:hypothetical protein